MPSSTPAGTCTLTVSLRRTRPVPLQLPQGFVTTLPLPWHCGQTDVDIARPNSVLVTCCTWPAPLQVGQVFRSEAFLVPPQS